MAKKQNQQKPAAHKQVPNAQAQPEQDKKEGKTTVYIWLAAILFITYICYQPLFSKQKAFTNWDDYGYVTDQPLIKELSSENLSELFKPSTGVMFNYHPLTMISLAIDYQRGYNEATNTIDIKPFATTNLVLHMVNTILVFFLIYKLSRKKMWAALCGSVLFAIHPMHVESVAWISERKDLLYCFFFLLSLLAYIKYLDTKKMSFLAGCFVLFIASCLSKAMATPLPLVLLLTDFLYKRTIGKKALIEKIPFFIIAILIGINAVNVQAGAISDMETYSILQRVLFASYGFCVYWLKMILPTQLSAFYPYPFTIGSGEIPGYFYVLPLIALTIVIAPVLLAKRKGYHFRDIIWGMGFFIFMIALVLQFVSVGQAIMADRYTYVAYIGPFFIAGTLFQDLVNKEKRKNIAIGALSVIVLIFSFITYKRVKIWNNSESLWTDVIKKYPYELTGEGEKITVAKAGVKTAYKNLGDHYAGQQMYDSALVYFDILAKAKTKDAEVWSNLGNIYAFKGELPEAIEAFTQSINYDSTNYNTYLARGVVYSLQKNYSDAMHDIDKVLAKESNNEMAIKMKEQWSAELQKEDNQPTK